MKEFCNVFETHEAFLMTSFNFKFMKFFFTIYNVDFLPTLYLKINQSVEYFP